MTDNIYNPDFVKGLFNRMSGSYERVNYITSFGFSIRWRRQFINRIPATDEKIEVIDLLTGMGENWESVRRIFPNANISSLDFSEEMIKRAELKNKKHFNNRILVLQQDILQNKLPSNYYDIVICAFGLKTFDHEQLKTLALETNRILKPGGKFSFVEVSKPDNFILKFFYGFYLGSIIPILGRLFQGDPTAYEMLWQYTEKFVNAKSVTEIFRNVGLTANYNSYFFGCASGFSGYK